MKKIMFIVVLLLVATAGTTKAQDAALTTEVNKCIELQNTRGMLVETLSMQYQTMVNNGQLAIDDVKRMSEEMADAIMVKLNDKLVQFYCDNYTLEEVKELNAFLASPVGKKNIQLTPKANMLGTQITQDPDVLTDLQEIIAKHMKTLNI